MIEKNMYAAVIAGIQMPARIHKLPIDARGFPIPWFVLWVDGAPDFRVIRPGGVTEAIRRRVCWVCGEPLGRHLAFVIGPMCSVNRVSSEPPLHRECAEFSVRACPFLVRPRMRRNTVDLPVLKDIDFDIDPNAIDHNPGAAAIWMTRSFQPFRGKGASNTLLRIGPADEILWFKAGRPATRSEVEAAFDKGLPFLRTMAQRDGLAAETEKAISDARKRLLPAS